MATRSRTYNASDWSIWTYQPEPGSFVLDFSKLDGPDLLGFTEGSMVEIDAQISNISLSEGSTISQGMFGNIEPATMSAELIIQNFQATDANKFYVGSAIFLYLTNATDTNPYVDTGLTFRKNNLTNFFMGFIESFNVSFEPQSNISTISIQAVSKTSQDLNTLIGVKKDTSTPKGTLINNSSSSFANWITNADNYNFGSTDLDSKSLGSFLNDFMMCELGTARDSCVITTMQLDEYAINSYDVNPQFDQQLFISGKQSVGTVSVSLDETTISSINLDWSGAGSPTAVALTLNSDSEITYNFGEPNSPGGFNYSGSPDVKDLTQLETIGQGILNFKKEFTPVSLMVETARTYQELTFAETPGYFAPFPLTQLFYFHQKPNSLAEVLETISITNTELGYIDLPMIVTGRTIEITPDNWTTTYDLWKGFTN